MAIPVFNNGDLKKTIRTGSLNPAILKVNDLEIKAAASDLQMKSMASEIQSNKTIINKFQSRLDYLEPTVSKNTIITKKSFVQCHVDGPTKTFTLYNNSGVQSECDFSPMFTGGGGGGGSIHVGNGTKNYVADFLNFPGASITQPDKDEPTHLTIEVSAKTSLSTEIKKPDGTGASGHINKLEITGDSDLCRIGDGTLTLDIPNKMVTVGAALKPEHYDNMIISGNTASTSVTDNTLNLKIPHFNATLVGKNLEDVPEEQIALWSDREDWFDLENWIYKGEDLGKSVWGEPDTWVGSNKWSDIRLQDRTLWNEPDTWIGDNKWDPDTGNGTSPRNTWDEPANWIGNNKWNPAIEDIQESVQTFSDSLTGNPLHTKTFRKKWSGDEKWTSSGDRWGFNSVDSAQPITEIAIKGAYGAGTSIEGGILTLEFKETSTITKKLIVSDDKTVGSVFPEVDQLEFDSIGFGLMSKVGADNTKVISVKALPTMKISKTTTISTPTDVKTGLSEIRFKGKGVTVSDSYDTQGNVVPNAATVEVISQDQISAQIGTGTTTPVTKIRLTGKTTGSTISGGRLSINLLDTKILDSKIGNGSVKPINTIKADAINSVYEGTDKKTLYIKGQEARIGDGAVTPISQIKITKNETTSINKGILTINVPDQTTNSILGVVGDGTEGQVKKIKISGSNKKSTLVDGTLDINILETPKMESQNAGGAVIKPITRLKFGVNSGVYEDSDNTLHLKGVQGVVGSATKGLSKIVVTELEAGSTSVTDAGVLTINVPPKSASVGTLLTVEVAEGTPAQVDTLHFNSPYHAVDIPGKKLTISAIRALDSTDSPIGTDGGIVKDIKQGKGITLTTLNGVVSINSDTSTFVAQVGEGTAKPIGKLKVHENVGSFIDDSNTLYIKGIDGTIGAASKPIKSITVVSNSTTGSSLSDDGAMLIAIPPAGGGTPGTPDNTVTVTGEDSSGSYHTTKAKTIGFNSKSFNVYQTGQHNDGVSVTAKLMTVRKANTGLIRKEQSGLSFAGNVKIEGDTSDIKGTTKITFLESKTVLIGGTDPTGAPVKAFDSKEIELKGNHLTLEKVEVTDTVLGKYSKSVIGYKGHTITGKDSDGAPIIVDKVGKLTFDGSAVLSHVTETDGTNTAIVTVESSGGGGTPSGIEVVGNNSEAKPVKLNTSKITFGDNLVTEIITESKNTSIKVDSKGISIKGMDDKGAENISKNVHMINIKGNAIVSGSGDETTVNIGTLSLKGKKTQGIGEVDVTYPSVHKIKLNGGLLTTEGEGDNQYIEYTPTIASIITGKCVGAMTSADGQTMITPKDMPIDKINITGGLSNSSYDGRTKELTVDVKSAINVADNIASLTSACPVGSNTECLGFTKNTSTLYLSDGNNWKSFAYPEMDLHVKSISKRFPVTLPNPTRYIEDDNKNLCVTNISQSSASATVATGGLGIVGGKAGSLSNIYYNDANWFQSYCEFETGKVLTRYRKSGTIWSVWSYKDYGITDEHHSVFTTLNDQKFISGGGIKWQLVQDAKSNIIFSKNGAAFSLINEGNYSLKTCIHLTADKEDLTGLSSLVFTLRNVDTKEKIGNDITVKMTPAASGNFKGLYPSAVVSFPTTHLTRDIKLSIEVTQVGGDATKIKKCALDPYKCYLAIDPTSSVVKTASSIASTYRNTFGGLSFNNGHEVRAEATGATEPKTTRTYGGVYNPGDAS